MIDERPPTVVPENIVPVGTIACPRNWSDTGGPWALAAAGGPRTTARTTTSSARSFFTATENALFQDGPAATPANGSRARILRYNLQTGRLDRQWFYLTDPVAQTPVPQTNFSVNGVVELLPLNNEFLIAM